MKAVLISIQPQWCEQIASNKKVLEIRKKRPKLGAPFKCYIYCTLSGSPDLFHSIGLERWNAEKWSDKKGKVIGEFICDNIRCFDVPYPAFQNELDKSILTDSCCTYYMLHRYAYHDALYGWHISALKICDKPKDFSEFNLKRAPQSWCYVEEQEAT